MECQRDHTQRRTRYNTIKSQHKNSSHIRNKEKAKRNKNPKNYIVIYSGVKQSVRAQSGVMIWVHKSLSKTTDHYKYWNERILEIRCKINREYLTILGLYAPEEGRQELTISMNSYKTFRTRLRKMIILMLGDLNARLGNNKTMKKIGTNGEPTINNNGGILTDFCVYNNITIMNSFFKHKDIHKYMWCAQGTKSIIDYAIANEKTAKPVKDTKVYRGAELNMDHFLLCTELQFLPKWKNSKNWNKFNRRNDHPPQTKYKTRVLNGYIEEELKIT
jgi:hypothetical protein